MNAKRTSRAGVLATQAAFVAGVLVLWYLATTCWGVSRILLPNPVAVWHALVDVLATGNQGGNERQTTTVLENIGLAVDAHGILQATAPTNCPNQDGPP